MLTDSELTERIRYRLDGMIRQHSVIDWFGFASTVQYDFKIPQAKALNIISNLMEEYGRR